MTFKEKKESVAGFLKKTTHYCDNIPVYLVDEQHIQPLRERCPECGGEMMTATLSSPADYWQHRCGRECIIPVCCQCGHESDIIMTKMN